MLIAQATAAAAAAENTNGAAHTIPKAVPTSYQLLDAKSVTSVFEGGEAAADIALVIHLFCFAETRAELLAMCRCVALWGRGQLHWC